MMCRISSLELEIEVQFNETADITPELISSLAYTVAEQLMNTGKQKSTVQSTLAVSGKVSIHSLQTDKVNVHPPDTPIRLVRN